MFRLLGEMPGPPEDWHIPWENASTGTSWWYPVCIMLGFVVAIVAGCLKLWKRYKVSTEPFYWFILIGVPMAILGSRFGSCAIGQTPWKQMFSWPWNGLAIEWGVMFAVVSAFIYFPLILKVKSYRVRDEFSVEHEVKKASMWMYFDAVVPAILIAQFIGRWGNYCNQEVYGAPVTSESLANFLSKCLPGMWIPNPEGFPAGWFQPLFLWEGLGNLAMFFVIYFGFEFIPSRKAGDLAGSYFIWYGTFRACLEPLRNPNFTDFGTSVNVSILISIIWACLGVLFILINHLLIAKTRDYKIWHTLFSRGPGEVFRMIGAGWGKQELVARYKDPKYADCVRKPAEKIYFGAW